MTTLVTPASRGYMIAIWALRVLLSLLFLAAATMKLTSQAQMVAEFQLVGLGQWFRYFTAALEVIGAVALLIPRASMLGAALLLLIDVGAFVAQIAVIRLDWIHTIVIGALLGLLIYLQRRIAS